MRVLLASPFDCQSASCPGQQQHGSTRPFVAQFLSVLWTACRKNGEHLGTAYRHVVATDLIPTVGLHRCARPSLLPESALSQAELMPGCRMQ